MHRFSELSKYHLGSWSWHGPGALGRRHMALELPPSWQLFSHSDMVMKLLKLPVHFYKHIFMVYKSNLYNHHS